MYNTKCLKDMFRIYEFMPGSVPSNKYWGQKEREKNELVAEIHSEIIFFLI